MGYYTFSYLNQNNRELIEMSISQGEREPKLKNKLLETSQEANKILELSYKSSDEKGNIYEIKSLSGSIDKEIDEHLVEIAYEKIKKFNPQRYFIIHTSTIHEKNYIKLNKKIKEIKEEHGCQIIIDNFFECLSTYLRLISNIEDYINLLSKNIIEDKELKLIHKKTWKEMVEKEFN